jgi:hypothetical protein
LYIKRKGQKDEEEIAMETYLQQRYAHTEEGESERRAVRV